MDKIKILNSFHLKVIALISMTIDHIGYFLFPNIILFRIIGRLSFVIFAYLSANAYLYTSNRIKHLLVLLSLALGYSLILFLVDIEYGFNIFICLFLGYLAIMLIDNKYYLVSLIIIIISSYLDFDYGLYGVLLIIASYLLFNKEHYLIIINIILILLLQPNNSIQLYSIIGTLLILLYNKQKGLSLKYLFYIYYPLHIIIIYLISQLII